MRDNAVTGNKLNATEQDEFLRVVEKLQRKFSKSFSFGVYGADDIGQEIALEAWEAIDRWDRVRSMEAFLLVNCQNRLDNLKRNKWFRASCPCKLCDGKADGETGHSGGKHCGLFKGWFKRNSVKCNLAGPPQLGDSFDAPQGEESPEEVMTRQELQDHIDENLPVALRDTYLRMKSGVRVANKDRDSVLQFLKGLLVKD